MTGTDCSARRYTRHFYEHPLRVSDPSAVHSQEGCSEWSSASSPSLRRSPRLFVMPSPTSPRSPKIPQADSAHSAVTLPPTSTTKPRRTVRIFAHPTDDSSSSDDDGLGSSSIGESGAVQETDGRLGLEIPAEIEQQLYPHTPGSPPSPAYPTALPPPQLASTPSSHHPSHRFRGCRAQPPPTLHSLAPVRRHRTPISSLHLPLRRMSIQNGGTNIVCAAPSVTVRLMGKLRCCERMRVFWGRLRVGEWWT